MMIYIYFFYIAHDNFVVLPLLATGGVREKHSNRVTLIFFREYYRYWTSYYGLPVAGWNAGNDGKDYYNHEA